MMILPNMRTVQVSTGWTTRLAEDSMKAIGIFVVILLSLYSGGSFLFAEERKIPNGVHPSAKYISEYSVWIWDKGSQRRVWYQDGTLKALGRIKNRLRVSSWIFYYPNGQKKGEGSYQKGKKQGEWKLFSQKGKVSSEGNFLQDKREGEWSHYYLNQTLKAKGPYHQGLKHGAWLSYYTNGKIFYEGEYRRGKAQNEWKYYYQNGSLYQKGKYDRDIRIGMWKICVFPQGPCGKEHFSYPKFPSISNLVNPSSSKAFSPSVNQWNRL